MSPISTLLLAYRTRAGLRQVDLAALIGFEQSYISALEVGLKGPPTADFVDRFAAAVELSAEETRELRLAAEASQRSLILSPDAPADIYWLVHALRANVHDLSPRQVRVMLDIVELKQPAVEERQPATQRRSRRREC